VLSVTVGLACPSWRLTKPEPLGWSHRPNHRPNRCYRPVGTGFITYTGSLASTSTAGAKQSFNIVVPVTMLLSKINAYTDTASAAGAGNPGNGWQVQFAKNGGSAINASESCGLYKRTQQCSASGTSTSFTGGTDRVTITFTNGSGTGQATTFAVSLAP
jgi:hypothetical protein